MPALMGYDGGPAGRTTGSRALHESLEQSGMIVVIDSPPLLPVTEAAIVAQ